MGFGVQCYRTGAGLGRHILRQFVYTILICADYTQLALTTTGKYQPEFCVEYNPVATVRNSNPVSYFSRSCIHYNQHFIATRKQTVMFYVDRQTSRTLRRFERPAVR